MRKLMWLTVGFAAACVAGAYLQYGLCIVAAIACALALCCILRFARPFLPKAICILIGCALGVSWFLCLDYAYLDPIRRMDGQATILDISVTEYSRQTDVGISVEGKTQIKGKTYKLIVYVNEDVELAPGDRIQGGFRLCYTGVGSKETSYHQGSGIFLLAFPKGSNEIIKADHVPVKYFAAWLHRRVSDIINVVFPGDTRYFANAVLLGNTSEMPFSAKWALKTSGIYHISAVSGMHISVLVVLIYILCGKHRLLSAIVGIPVLLVFAAVVGFSPSVVRACVMHILMMIALAADVEFDPPTALAAGVLILLAVNPLCITSVGFQLSVGCMIGVLFFTERIHGFLLSQTKLGPAKGKTLKAKATRFFVASVSMTLGATLLTIPLSAAYFGTVSIAGVLANLLLLWLVSFVFYGIIVTCVLGAIWTPLGMICGWMVSWPVRLILGVSKMISKIPLSSVFTCGVYIIAWLVFVYILITVFAKSKKKQPIVLTCCILVGLLGAVACSWLELRCDHFRITAVDVGQGQCLVLQYEDKFYMVDCGGDSDDIASNAAAQLLMSQGIFRLDGLIVTHYDADHAGGVMQLLNVIPADKLYLPIQEEESDIQDALSNQYSDRITWVNKDIVLEEVNITIFASSNPYDSNESSLCILFQPENCDILITGDRSEEGELSLLEHTDLPDLEILIAGHHGSATSTSWALLNATRPEVVIISVGEDNRYGHPKQETLERLQSFGCGIYRTDLEGTIIFRG